MKNWKTHEQAGERHNMRFTVEHLEFLFMLEVCEDYDWESFLEQVPTEPRDRKIYGEVARTLAVNWTCCAAGDTANRYNLPVDELDRPLDSELIELGMQFFRLIFAEDYPEAARLLISIRTRGRILSNATNN